MSGVAEPAPGGAPREQGSPAQRHTAPEHTLHTRKPPGESVKLLICCDLAALDKQPQSCGWF